MSHLIRLRIEVETGPDGPSGTARDEHGRTTEFSGWLELIALIEAPLPANGAHTAPGGESWEATK